MPGRLGPAGRGVAAGQPGARGPAGTLPAAVGTVHVDRSHLPTRTRLAAAAGDAAGRLSRRLGRGNGSAISGWAILALEPDALRHLAAGYRSAVVSGTNGKTTTTCLLRAALATAGPVASNVLGANLPTGVAAALATGVPGALAALEVDEAWLARVVEAVQPTVALLLNLSRDQLDRNTEVRSLAQAWRRTFAGRHGTVVVANCDDPLVTWGASAAPAVRWVAAGQPWTADAVGCPRCGGRIDFFSLPAGAWGCSGCDLRRPAPDVTVEDDRVVDADGTVVTLRLALPGRANQVNAAMALTAARLLGADPVAAARAVEGTDEVVGRYRRCRLEGIEIRLLLAKNPAGWLEVLDVLAPAPTPVVIAINARIADGRDPSWLWDVPFDRLAGHPVVATGERGRDLTVALRYADLDTRHEADPLAAVRAGAARARSLGVDTLDVVANYTAFQALRARLR
jgi:UDP-N-acetylmuramyl tripeptide synthase